MTAVDVAIVGGGAVGAACARAAALRGLEVAIFEPGPDPAAASPASAGMLAAQIEPLDDVLIGLSVRGRDLYEPLAPALQETTGIDIGFWRAGIASVAFDDQTADRLKEEDRKSTRLNSSHTVTSYAVFCLKKKKNRKLAATTDRHTLVRCPSHGTD